MSELKPCATDESMRAEIERLRDALTVMIERYSWEALAHRQNAADNHPEDDACVIQARLAPRPSRAG